MARTTLYAAFTDKGEPVLGVWEWYKSDLNGRISDRVANGHAFPGEHPVQITISFYNEILRKRGWPEVPRR